MKYIYTVFCKNENLGDFFIMIKMLLNALTLATVTNRQLFSVNRETDTCMT